MNNDNLEETKRLNKQSSDRKNANNTNDVNLDETQKLDTQPDKNKDLIGISKSAMSTMSSGSNNHNFKIDK